MNELEEQQEEMEREEDYNNWWPSITDQLDYSGLSISDFI